MRTSLSTEHATPKEEEEDTLPTECGQYFIAGSLNTINLHKNQFQNLLSILALYVQASSQRKICGYLRGSGALNL